MSTEKYKKVQFIVEIVKSTYAIDCFNRKNSLQTFAQISFFFTFIDYFSLDKS